MITVYKCSANSSPLCIYVVWIDLIQPHSQRFGICMALRSGNMGKANWPSACRNFSRFKPQDTDQGWTWKLKDTCNTEGLQGHFVLWWYSFLGSFLNEGGQKAMVGPQCLGLFKPWFTYVLRAPFHEFILYIICMRTVKL